MIFSALTSKIFGGVAIASITFAVVQTVRIEGFWLIKGYEQRLDDAEGTIADMRIAAELALSAQEAMNNHRRTLDTNNAEIADVKFTANKSAASAAATVYIDRWRVRKDSGCPGATDSPSQGRPAVVPEAMPAAGVLVSEQDVRACTDATTYALGAYDHAARQVATGVAEFK